MAASGPGTGASIPGSQPGAWSSSSLFRSVRQSWKMALSTVAPPRACCRADRKRGEIATSSRTFMLRQRFVPRQSSARSDRRIGRRPLARSLPPLAGRSRNSSTNSSRGTPSASQSKSCCTGSRLPRKHGAPLMRSGSTHTASSRVTTSFIGIEPVGVQSKGIEFQSVVKQ